jgi:SAM-dependent methyltransferase
MNNIFNKTGFNFMKSKGRAVLHGEIIPKFAKRFNNGDLVINIGTHRFWDYEPYFVNPGLLCDYHSIDIVEVRDQLTGEIRGEIGNVYEIQYDNGTVDGFLFIGMHDNIAEQKRAYESMLEELKPGGLILIAFPGSGAKCGGELVGMDEWQSFLTGYIVDDVHYVYDPENQDRYTDGKNTSIIVVARKPHEKV